MQMQKRYLFWYQIKYYSVFQAHVRFMSVQHSAAPVLFVENLLGAVYSVMYQHRAVLYCVFVDVL
jgi:hypothetical protein